MVIPLNPLYLANFDDHNETDEISGKLKAGLSSVENTDLCRQIFATGFENEELTNLIKGYVEDKKTITEVFHLATCAFLKFMDINWNPHPEALNVNEFFGVEWPAAVEAATLLQRDSEPLYVNILFPELLLFSSQIFTVLQSIESNVLFLWWNLRCKVSHQRALEDASATIYSELEVLIAKLSNELQNSELFVSKPRLKLLACTEICQAYLLYGRVQKAEEYLTKGRELAGLKLELTGILGKRTKYQQNALPQLALSSALDSNVERPSAEDSHGSSELPPDLELDDDLRLNKIQYNEKISQAELPSLEQTLCLLTVQYIQKSQPKDDLMREELQPYIDAVLSQKSGAWSTRVATLLIRCQLEATHKRTVERAMLQCETIVNDKTGVSSTTRLSYVWASGLAPSWGWRQQLADLYLSLGLTKAALEQYHALCLWEDVIVCYTMLQLRHKRRLSYLWASGLPPSWGWRQQLADLCLSLGLTKAALEQYRALCLWADVIVCYTMLQLRHKRDGAYLWASGLPPSWGWRQQLADLCLSLGLTKAALEQYRALCLWEDVIVCYTMLQLRHKRRLSYLWASGLPPSWGWRQQLADLCLSLGLTKAALEQYRALCLWEDVIVCYTMLQLRHKVGYPTYLWASGLPPSWGWRQQLADLCLSLGLTNAALEQYRALCLWEDVIVCYTMLQLRHKAAEVIQQQIDIKPTVKLYCLLGDATDDITCYERAWQFSHQRSSRAQRHWGNYLFDRKQYTECIPHFQQSLEINSIQERVWLRLGYAALETEQWETSATAYRRYTYLHPNTFEAWNNLAKVYVQQGDKPRAYRALMEALRFNYDNWKAWNNLAKVYVLQGDKPRAYRALMEALRFNYDNWNGSYTYLHPNTFEAWNNLAKVYVQQGDKPRAYRALMEALRFNYDNWKVTVLMLKIVALSWENGSADFYGIWHPANLAD
ncbi:unnamed protein product [Plutella xylostella]|uniref:(diamondback moth) hypothetical protein n=1 Tax=Plutella xylostella TaxID=51655 RepID=A0A8S4EHK4_PLUXY|nr:unnamed protein product [Plutella xylostella]